MRAPPALAVLAALLAALRSAASSSAVPSPTRTVVTSKNLKTVLWWQYPSMSETPHFVVEVKPYSSGSYKIVSGCVYISANFCDLSEEIQDYDSSYWFRIKAFVGSQQSEYVETEEFILQKHGEIGPPKLDLSRQGDKIVLDIYHPAFPSVEVQPWISDFYSDVSYKVTLGNSKTKSKDVIFVDNCNMSKCSKNIPVPYEDSTFCLSAQGSFYDNLIISAPSEERCIQVPLKWTWSSQDAIIVCVVVLIVGLILTVCCGFKKLRKKNIKLPKSLVSVIRNLNADNSLESKSEAKDISVVSVMPVSSINDDEALLTVESEGETVSPESSSGGASSGLPLEASDKVEETSVQESAKEIPSDNEQNCEVKESIFISDSNQTDVCSNSSGPEVSATEIRQAVIPTSCLKFSGYDKPHVPLDMLIDVGEEQPVIAYRPTEPTE